MKTWIIVLCAVALLLSGCVTNKPAVEAPKVVVDWEQIEERDALWYFEEKPFTGVAVKKSENGQKAGEVTHKDGKWHGLATFWYENGQKEMEYTFKDGEAHGLWTEWYENGQKKEESTHKDGKFISKKEWDEDGNPLGQDQGGEAPKPAVEVPKGVVDADQLEDRDDLYYFEGKPFTGVAVRKYANGKIEGENTYKDGKLHGLGTGWNENGQKWYERTYKDGKRDGLYTWWYENGQKRKEATYKDGKSISTKYWDQAGNPLYPDRGLRIPPPPNPPRSR